MPATAVDASGSSAGHEISIKVSAFKKGAALALSTCPHRYITECARTRSIPGSANGGTTGIVMSATTYSAPGCEPPAAPFHLGSSEIRGQPQRRRPASLVWRLTASSFFSAASMRKIGMLGQIGASPIWNISQCSASWRRRVPVGRKRPFLPAHELTRSGFLLLVRG